MKTKQISGSTTKIIKLALSDVLGHQREVNRIHEAYEAAKQRLRKLMTNAGLKNFSDLDGNAATIFTALTRHYSVEKLKDSKLTQYLVLRPNTEMLSATLAHSTDKALVQLVKWCVTKTEKRPAILVRPACKKDCKNCQCSGKKGKA